MRRHELQAFLASVPPEAREVAVALREVVRRAAPDAEESLLWGTLSYHRPWIGGRVKGAVCQINVVRGEVRLEFIHGVRLDDPRKLCAETASPSAMCRFAPSQRPGDRRSRS